MTDDAPSRPEEINSNQELQEYLDRVINLTLDDLKQELKALDSHSQRIQEVEESISHTIEGDMSYTNEDQADQVINTIGHSVEIQEGQDLRTALFLELKRLAMNELSEFDFEFFFETSSPLMKGNGYEIRFNSKIKLKKADWTHPEHTEFKVYFEGEKVESYTLGWIEPVRLQRMLRELQEKHEDGE